MESNMRLHKEISATALHMADAATSSHASLAQLEQLQPRPPRFLSPKWLSRVARFTDRNPLPVPALPCTLHHTPRLTNLTLRAEKTRGGPEQEEVSDQKETLCQGVFCHRLCSNDSSYKQATALITPIPVLCQCWRPRINGHRLHIKPQ